MVVITAQLVKDLREETGVGMMDAKNALQEAQGDKEKAKDILRTKGLAKAAKKSERATSEGLVESYIHAGGRIGVLVEVASETDFVARTDEFKSLVHDMAMHIAGAAPLYIAPEDVAPEELEKEQTLARAELKEQGKPAATIEKILPGKIEKYYEQVCLLRQPFIKDQSKTIQDLLGEAVGKMGENIRIKRFARFVLGE
jgi:elongation factor Ts